MTDSLTSTMSHLVGALMLTGAPEDVALHTSFLQVAQGPWLFVVPDPDNVDGRGEFDSSPQAAVTALNELIRLAGDPHWQTPCDFDEIATLSGFAVPSDDWHNCATPTVSVDKNWLRSAVRSCDPEEWRAMLIMLSDFRHAYADTCGSMPPASRMLAMMEGTLRAAMVPLRAA